MIAAAENRSPSALKQKSLWEELRSLGGKPTTEGGGVTPRSLGRKSATEVGGVTPRSLGRKPTTVLFCDGDILLKKKGLAQTAEALRRGF